ncbi:DUF930 domain-containing protein [Rhizobium sp. G21]|uniref:DUF930 domain-containing protein n=1 Tax=Rhizobium sp. G21 TaxID=2758439 RepID=UPI001FEE31B7|nr:DUF930 domain-containing protein [Rhizobium sp. G21]
MNICRMAALAASLLAPLSAHAIDQKMLSQIKRLAPRDQLEQRCDTEGMAKVKGDKVIAYTFSDPHYRKAHIDAPGAVFRRNGEWYRLSYSCTTSPDHVAVISFKYKIGSRVPREEWEQYQLYD